MRVSGPFSQFWDHQGWNCLWLLPTCSHCTVLQLGDIKLERTVPAWSWIFWFAVFFHCRWMEKGPCGALTQNINLILSKHWKNSLFPQHLHFILHRRRHPGRCSSHPSRTRCSGWQRVLKCCYLLSPKSRIRVGLRWDQLGEAVRCIPDSTAGMCSSLLLNVGECKRRKSGVCWLLSGEPNFCKRAGSPGNWSKILFQAQSIRTVLG